MALQRYGLSQIERLCLILDFWPFEPQFTENSVLVQFLNATHSLGLYPELEIFKKRLN